MEAVFAVFAVVIVFCERRDPKSVWAWLLLLYFVPFFGFALYLLLGRGIRNRRRFRIKEYEEQLHETVRQQEHCMKEADVKEPELIKYRDLILYNLKSGSVLTKQNRVEFLTDGKDKFDCLVEDMRAAKHFIHLQYYIIRDDILFEKIGRVLEEKVKEGVEVRILYDAMGCRKVGKSFWRNWDRKGIRTEAFFPALFGRLHLRVNYRNHRKIAVIDNRVAYVGGFNIGKEYIGLEEKFGYWRDTHLRLQGPVVVALQLRFLLDWNCASGENLLSGDSYLVWKEEMPQKTEEMPDRTIVDTPCTMQIISSGPDNDRKQIRDNYLRLISGARKCIFIQTPYFIPDEAVLEALLLAARSGIEVNIMIPCKPDHPFVYWATYSYLGEMIMAGANCYTYEKGFLHSKGIAVDDEIACIGTANVDIRSFTLNFEVNAVIYESAAARRMAEIFRRDLKDCRHITRDDYQSRGIIVRGKEQICRLLSPLL